MLEACTRTHANIRARGKIQSGRFVRRTARAHGRRFHAGNVMASGGGVGAPRPDQLLEHQPPQACPPKPRQRRVAAAGRVPPGRGLFAHSKTPLHRSSCRTVLQRRHQLDALERAQAQLVERSLSVHAVTTCKLSHNRGDRTLAGFRRVSGRRPASFGPPLQLAASKLPLLNSPQVSTAPVGTPTKIVAGR